MSGRIFITGDVHRNLDIEKLWWKNFRTQEQLDRDDYMIVLGDFGAVWDKYTDGKILSWWESKPYTTLFIDGNHENFDLLNKYPIEEKLGGKVGVIKPHVWHLLRGESYHIAGRDFWCFGGARSIDLANRRMGKTWWPQEIPSEEDYQNGLIGLEKINYKPANDTLDDISKRLSVVEKWIFDTEANKFFNTLFNDLLNKTWAKYVKDMAKGTNMGQELFDKLVKSIVDLVQIGCLVPPSVIIATGDYAKYRGLSINNAMFGHASLN